MWTDVLLKSYIEIQEKWIQRFEWVDGIRTNEWMDGIRTNEWIK